MSVLASQLLVVGEIADTSYDEKLKGLEVKICPGIKKAIAFAAKLFGLLDNS